MWTRKLSGIGDGDHSSLPFAEECGMGLEKASLLPSGGLGGCQLSSMIHNHFKKLLATLCFAGICKERKHACRSST